MDLEKDYLEPLDLGASRSQSSPIARTIIFIVFAGLVLVGWRYSGPHHALADGGWIDDWDRAVEQAKTSDKPALVLFTADWCPACRQFESETLADPKVQEYLKENHTLVVVDLSDRAGPNNQRARDFKVHAIPTLILFDRSGEEKARDFGMPSDALLKWLRVNSNR